MASLAASNPHPQPRPGRPSTAGAPTIEKLLPIILTPLVLLVHGYHPFANDGGLYVAGIRHILTPTLYPRNAVFIAAFTHRSVFPWIVAGLVRITRLPLSWILLATHLFSIALFLYAAGRLAARLFSNPGARVFSILLAAACCVLPVAGTALVLMDPYVTARSFSTPLSLLAVAATLDTTRPRRWPRLLGLIALALAFHPLMGACAAAFVLLLALVNAGRVRAAILLCASAFVLAGVIFALTLGSSADLAYREAVSLAPHSFLFLSRWRWYEVLGLLLPLALFALALRRIGSQSATGALCLASILLGSTALLIAACFVPSSGPYPLAPFQVLRSFHLIYCTGVILCGGLLVPRVSSIGPNLAEGEKPEPQTPRIPWLPASLLVLLFATMFQVERLEWPGSVRLELPGLARANAYVQAFLWIRAHTPPTAVFAFNPRLVYLPGEDEQNFRAISKRDQLADDKDAGVAAVLPALASRWAAQRNAELAIDTMSDTRRRATLAPLGVTWLLLPPSAPTSLPCPWHNSVVQVCRLRP